MRMRGAATGAVTLTKGGYGMRVRELVLASVAAASLAGCHKQPGGQVIATVNGQEITRRDLLGELRALGGRSEADLNSVQAGLTSALVDRTLLVEEAKREKLDKNPEFLAAEQRQHDVLLATMLAQTFNQRVKKPDAAAVAQFIAANPQMFGGRKVLQVSEISVTGKGMTPQALAPLHTQQAVLDYLKAHKIPFGQRVTALDTLSLPKGLTDKLLGMPAGEPLAIGNNAGGYVITTVLATREAPVPANQQATVAQSAMMQQAAGKQLQDQIQQLRATADIKYLPGFAPPKPAAGATPTS